MNLFARLAAAAIALLFVSCQNESATTAPGWSVDLDQALVEAKATHKPVMLEFTGSTWCPPCIAINKDVFSKPEFIEGARDKVLLVEIDVPYPGKENRAKDMALAARNTRISKEYGIEGFPYIVLLDPVGKEIARFDPTPYPSPDLMLGHLDKLLK